MEYGKKKIRIELILLIVAVVCILTAVIAAIAVSGGGEDEPEPSPASAEPSFTPAPTPTPSPVPLTPETPVVADLDIYEDIIFPEEPLDLYIGETGLVLQGILSYTGNYLEDGSDSPVQGVCAIKLLNDSGKDISYATLQFADQLGRELSFTFSNLPDGWSIIVLEAEKSFYMNDMMLSLAGQLISDEPLDLMPSEIYIEDGGDNSLIVRNISDADFSNLRFHYKYLYDSETLLGGISYSCRVGELIMGAAVSVAPTRYVSGGCRVVRIFDGDGE
ncbi:MAG: hypothetical protein Q4C04_04895 [Clostridia bacterium]|nr:hypothetical protein [Clostridia bacterium]